MVLHRLHRAPQQKTALPRDGEAPFLLIEQHDGGPGVFCFRQSIRSE
jgi:hypothetical protein